MAHDVGEADQRGADERARDEAAAAEHDHQQEVDRQRDADRVGIHQSEERGEERAAQFGNRMQVDCIAHPLRHQQWMPSVRVHADDGRAQHFALLASACIASFFVTVARSSFWGSGLPLAAATSHMWRTLCICAAIAAMVRPLPPGGSAFQAASSKFSSRYWLMRSFTA